MTTKFYKCETCGNVAVKLVDSKVPLVCCGKPMQELVPNTVDASNEKHVPVVTRLDNNTIKVEVGSVAHPMEKEHHIAFIYVETDKGGIRVDLTDKPEAVIALGDSGRYQITDLDGNRYEIVDLYKLSVNERKKLDLFI